jgi:recombination protein RecA
MASVTDAIKKLERKYETKIVHLEGEVEAFKVNVIPTGLAPLDIATGVGGIPLGFFTEIYSPESVGKTTLSLQIIANAQKMGLPVAFIDMEHRLDPEWAAKLGVDHSEMLFTQPPFGEAALNIARTLIESHGTKLIVIDSVPSLVPKKELEGETGDQFVGLQARMIAQHFRQMTPALKKNNATVLLTNQLRFKIGGTGSLAYGPQHITAGGWAVKYYASMRLELKRLGAIKGSDSEVRGQKVMVTIRKSSLSTPLRNASLVLNYGIGFDPAESIIDTAINLGFIEKSSTWYTVNGEKMQGIVNVAQYLRDNPEVLKNLYDKVMRLMLPARYEGNDED